jgi:LysM repeat protein
MKILKIFGIVVGIHVFALILIFANPGCSAMTKSTPAPADTAAAPDAASPSITVPNTAAGDSTTGFDPNAPAISVSTAIRYSPTRPNTPAAGALEAEPVADVTPATTYTVAKGDSLSAIAHRNHLTKAELAAANNLRSEATIRVGQKLLIPGKATSDMAGAKASAPASAKTAAAEPSSTPKGPADSVKHVVKAGETLGAIARKYQVKLSDIAIANNIADPAKIRPGTELIIPGWQTPVGKSGAKGSAKTAAEPAKPAAIPTISVAGEDQEATPAVKPATDAPPTITVEDAPPPKKP